MVLNKINILKILFIFFSVIVFCFLIIKNTNQIETNLAKSILPKNIIENSNIIPILEKHSSTIKISFEAQTQEKINTLKENFMQDINKNAFYIEDNNISELLDFYNKYPTNFLSKNTKKLLQNNDFETVYLQGITNLYNPTGIQITDFNKDPFLLLTDFLLSNNVETQNLYFDNKFYDSIIIKIKPEIKKTNNEISKIVKLKNKYSNKEQKIHLAGAPIHTYHTSLSSAITINIVCALITILIIFLTYFYFKNYFLLIPIALSIAFGYLASFSITNTIFENFHIITILFGTTLIGIGIDYSYHYIFSENKDLKLYKDLTFSFLSTIITFSLLYILKIDILNQIATFTNIGLLAIFIFILTIYPCINFPTPNKYYIPNLNIKNRKILISTILIILIIGFIRLKFNDSLNSLYKPNKALIKAETLFNKITNKINSNGTIITVSSTRNNNLIEEEEKITTLLDNEKIDYISISKFLPSVNTQKENFKLVKNLYKNKLKNYNNLLSEKQLKTLMEKDFSYETFKNYDKLFNDLLLNDKTSLIIPTSNTQIPEMNASNIEVINFQNTISKHLKKYRLNILKLLPLIYLSLYTLLIFAYGFKKSSKMILPIILSSFLTIALLSIISIEINLFNILGLLLGLGFSIDYAIFNKNKTKESESAIFLACVTTSISFILLSFTSFKLISTLALTISLCIIFNYILIKIFTDKKEI